MAPDEAVEESAHNRLLIHLRCTCVIILHKFVEVDSDKHLIPYPSG